MCNLTHKESNQVNSQQVFAILLYFASAEERETICYFLHFQETRVPPNVTQYHVSDCRVRLQLPQSASQYTVST